MWMNVEGMGIVFAGGRGPDALDESLRRGWEPPEVVEVTGLDDRAPVREVAKDTMRDRETLKGMRRADRLSRMATLAAVDAWQAGGGKKNDTSRVGVVIATALGSHERTFQFLDDILDYGEIAVSPTTFSHSVHNAAASYVATALDIHGPVMTVTDFEFGFHQALTAAQCWLQQDRCDRVLVGAVEELGDVLLHASARLGRLPPDGRPQALVFEPEPAFVPGEGAAFFVLGPDGGEGGSVCVGRPGPLPVELSILDAEGLGGDDSGYLNHVPAEAPVANYAPIFGSMMTGAAFQSAVAVLSLQRHVRYPCPLADHNPHGLDVCRRAEPLGTAGIRCISLGRADRPRYITFRP